MTSPRLKIRLDRADAILSGYRHGTHNGMIEVLCDLLTWLDHEDIDIDQKLADARRLFDSEQILRIHAHNPFRCAHCGAQHHWSWTEAFDKFGFDDGDGTVMTAVVAEALRADGYTVTYGPWGLHNVVITAIDREGQPLIPAGTDVGYDDPRAYLPRKVVELLDRVFGPDTEVVP